MLVKKSQIILALARKFPLPFQQVVRLCGQGSLPREICNHWLLKTIERELLHTRRFWIGRQIRANNMTIEFDPRDYIGQKILENGSYEWETIEFLRRYLKPGMVFMDIGANIGQYSILASQLVVPGGEVHSFEPDPLLYKVLRRNLRRNGSRNVVINKSAISNSDGKALLFLSNHSNYGTSSLTPPPITYSGIKVAVRTVSLDSYVRAKYLRRIDAIKLDIEGAEVQALEGARTLLRDHVNLVLIVEFCDGSLRRFGHSTDHLASYLRSYGFQLFRFHCGQLEPYKRLDNEPCYFNVVACRNIAL